MSWLLQAAFAFTLPVMIASGAALGWRAGRQAGLPGLFRAWWALAATGAFIAGIASGWPYATGAAVSLAAALASWWRSRRRRHRAPRSLGAKTMAKLTALVKQMPRVAPRLKPQGAPA